MNPAPADRACAVGEPFIPWRRFHGAFIPDQLARCHLLSPGAKLCWAQLARHAGESGTCFPREATLAREVGKCVRQVKRYLRELRDASFIRVAKRGLNEPNHYEFLWHEIFEGAISLKPQEGTFPSLPAGTQMSRPEGTFSSHPFKEEESQSRESPLIDRSSQRPPARKADVLAWPAEDLETMKTVIESFILTSGRHAICEPALTRTLLRKCTHFLASPLVLADIFERKRRYVAQRPSCQPETERWFCSVAESALKAWDQERRERHQAIQTPPRMPQGHEDMAPESAALVATLARAKGF